MTTIICPKCGKENPDSAMNCTQCRINLQFALDHPEGIIRPEVVEMAEGNNEEQAKKVSLGMRLGIFIGGDDTSCGWSNCI